MRRSHGCEPRCRDPRAVRDRPRSPALSRSGFLSLAISTRASMAVARTRGSGRLIATIKGVVACAALNRPSDEITSWMHSGFRDREFKRPTRTRDAAVGSDVLDCPDGCVAHGLGGAWLAQEFLQHRQRIAVVESSRGRGRWRLARSGRFPSSTAGREAGARPFHHAFRRPPRPPRSGPRALDLQAGRGPNQPRPAYPASRSLFAGGVFRAGCVPHHRPSQGGALR